jgi:Uma2 family endonuclease
MSGDVARKLELERNSPEVEAAFEAVPAEMVGQILDGELHVMPRPGRRHTRAASALGAELVLPFDRGRGGPGGWVILDEPELHLGPRPDKLVPDLAGWRRERMPDVLGPDDAPAHFDLAPDWICEIVSVATERVDRGAKMRIYRREGVRHLWLLHPVVETLEAYRLSTEGWLLIESWEGDAMVRAEPFEAIEFQLSSLWAR